MTSGLEIEQAIFYRLRTHTGFAGWSVVALYG